MPARSPMIVSVVCVGLVAVAYALPGARSYRDDGWTIAGFRDEGGAFQSADALDARTRDGEQMEAASGTSATSTLLPAVDFATGWKSVEAALQLVGFSVAGFVDAANAQSGNDRAGSQRAGNERASQADIGRSANAEASFSRVAVDPVSGAKFEGTGPAGANIVLWRQGRAVGRATVSQKGRWSVQLDEPFVSGDHSVTLAVDPNGGRTPVFGQEVRISIPANFRDGGAVTIEVPDAREEEPAPGSLEPGNNAYADSLRRRAEDLARAASQRFDQIAPPSEPVVVDPDLQTKRVARQTGQVEPPGEDRETSDTGPALRPDERDSGAASFGIPMPERRSDRDIEIAGKSSGSDSVRDGDDGSVLAPVLDWLERSARKYQNVIVPGLSDPPKTPEELRAGRPSSDEVRQPMESARRDVEDARRARMDEQEQLDREAAELRRRRAAELRAREAQAEAVARADAEREAAERAEAERMRERTLVTAEEAERSGGATSPVVAPDLGADRQDAAEEGQRRLDAEAEALRQRRLDDAIRLSEDQRRSALDAQVARLEAERARRLAEREQAQRDAAETREREAKQARAAEDERQGRALLDQRERARVDALRIAEDQRREAMLNAKLRRAREVARLDDAYRASQPEAAPVVEPDDRLAASRENAEVAVLLPERRPAPPFVDSERERSPSDQPRAPRVALSPPLPDRDETKRPVRIDVSRLVVPEENTRRRLNIRTVYEQGSALRGPVDDDDQADGRYAENRISVREPRVRYRASNQRLSNACHARAGKKVRLGGTYIVAPGDTLWAISRRHYKLGRRYPIIYRANRKKIKDPDLIYPCQRIYIPKR